MSAAAKLKRNLNDQVDIVVYEKGCEISYGACGIPFYVADTIKEDTDLLERTAEQFAESGIDVRQYHEVIAVDTAAKTVTVRDLGQETTFTREYDTLIVASGAGVRHIPPMDTPRDNLTSIRNVGDGTTVKNAMRDSAVKHVVVVGAGFIGLEMIEACVTHGKRVTLVEFADHILSVMDPEMTAPLVEELHRQGVDVRTGTRVSELVCDGSLVTGVVLDQGGRQETLATDLVINCAGIAPSTGFIDVDKAPNGAILVNENMETSAPDVYAAGDCCMMPSAVTGKHQYTPMGTNANKQGRIIAELLSGKPRPDFKLIGCSAIRLFSLDAAKVGLNEADAKNWGLDVKTSLITGNSYASYYGKDRITIKLVYDAHSRVILGAQLVGRGVVVARANYYALAIRTGLTVDQFGYQDFCYSPPFGGVWDVTLIAANAAK